MDLMYIYHVPLVTTKQMDIWKPSHAPLEANHTLLEERAPNVHQEITLMKGVLATRVLLESIVGKMRNLLEI